MSEQLQSDFDKIVKTSKISKEEILIKEDFLNKFIESGFPNRKQEDWKFLDISQIIKKNIGDLSFFNDYSLPNKIDTSIFVDGLEHNKIIFINGRIEKIDFSYEDQNKIEIKDEIEKNTKNIEGILKKFLDTNDKNIKPIFVNNYEWLKDLNYISFLRDIGKHFTINKMLTYESVKTRLDREQSLSYMEFNYMILQAYDFLELNKKENCLLQIGGSDQWGNIVNGVDLIKRHSNQQTYGLTTPLITLATGAKMGKTENGAIWLDEKFLSPYDYWQFWRNIDDRDVIKFLKMFTDLDIEEIDKILKGNINLIIFLL